MLPTDGSGTLEGSYFWSFFCCFVLLLFLVLTSMCMCGYVDVASFLVSGAYFILSFSWFHLYGFGRVNVVGIKNGGERKICLQQNKVFFTGFSLEAWMLTSSESSLLWVNLRLGRAINFYSLVKLRLWFYFFPSVSYYDFISVNLFPF